MWTQSPRALGFEVTQAAFRIDERAPPRDLEKLGFVALGPRAVRVDVVERLLELERDPREAWLAALGSASGANKRELPRVERALGKFTV